MHVQTISTTTRRPAGEATLGIRSSLSRLSGAVREAGPFLLFYVALVVIQGVHLFEHVVQFLQVTVLDVPDDDALGLLGYVLSIQGTEEWLHLVFNGLYVLALYALLFPLWRRVPAYVPSCAFWGFAVVGVGLETWHIAEHGVIISHVVANGGCPCPGILDARLGVSDTYLHFGYNVAVYAAVLLPFWYVVRSSTTAPTAGAAPRTRTLHAGSIASGTTREPSA